MRVPFLRKSFFCSLVILLLCSVNGQHACAKPVLIVHPADIPQFTRPAEVIEDIYGNDVTVLHFAADVTTGNLLDTIERESPLTIFAFGSKAAYLSYVASVHLPQTKILLAQLPRKHLQKLVTSNNNIAGISLELDPATQLLNVTTILPEVQRVGVMYSDQNSLALIQKAIKIPSSRGFKLISAPIDHAGQFKIIFKKIARHIDSFLITSDPVFYNVENLSWLIGKCKKYNIRLFGQSSQLAEAGALLTVNADLNSLGYQLHAMAQGMHDMEFQQVQAPIGTHITMNSKTASLFGVVPQQSYGALIGKYVY